MNYEGKFGTEDPQDKGDALENLFIKSNAPDLADTDEALQTPMLIIDMDELDKKTLERATLIINKLAAYYFDQRYIDNHPYVTSKITQEIDNIRRLLKMLSVNEKAQDTLIMSIAGNMAKGTLYSSLTSLQNSMLQMQSQLNSLTSNLENIFKEMQDNCDKTFQEKEKETSEDGSMVVRGSRDFIKEITNSLTGMKIKNKEENLENTENHQIISNVN
jgi:hypothetical protein